MHGLSFASKRTERLLFRSPKLPFGNSGSKLQSPPASPFCLELASRNDLSLTRNDCPFPDHHYKVKVPGLLLQRLTEPSSEPVRPATPSPPWLVHVCSSLSEITATFPLPDSGPATSASPRISTPLWGSSDPLRIEAFNPIRCQKAHLLETPDFPSLPRTDSC
jgi:hypothetical protein